MIPLDKYADYIDIETLTRAGQYYYEGKIIDIQWNENILSAEALGTETYQIKLTIVENNIAEHICSCPIDQEDLCKHKVGLIIHLQEERLRKILDYEG